MKNIHISDINDAVDLAAKRLLRHVSRDESEAVEGDAVALSALLEMRRHKLAEICPTCEGKGTWWVSDAKGTQPCVNRAHHL